MLYIIKGSILKNIKYMYSTPHCFHRQFQSKVAAVPYSIQKVLYFGYSLPGHKLSVTSIFVLKSWPQQGLISKVISGDRQWHGHHPAEIFIKVYICILHAKIVN